MLRLRRVSFDSVKSHQYFYVMVLLIEFPHVYLRPKLSNLGDPDVLFYETLILSMRFSENMRSDSSDRKVA